MGLIKVVVVDGIHLSDFNMMEYNGINSTTRKLHRVIAGTTRRVFQVVNIVQFPPPKYVSSAFF
jgi:hypothetical protein